LILKVHIENFIIHTIAHTQLYTNHVVRLLRFIPNPSYRHTDLKGINTVKYWQASIRVME